MISKDEKSKNGAGKFILGALIGVAAGAVAGHFATKDAKDPDESYDDCDCGCNCEDEKSDSKKKA